MAASAFLAAPARCLLAALLVAVPYGGIAAPVTEPGPDPAQTRANTLEQGILQPSDEDFGMMNTRWDITQNPELMHDIWNAIADGIACLGPMSC